MLNSILYTENNDSSYFSGTLVFVKHIHIFYIFDLLSHQLVEEEQAPLSLLYWWKNWVSDFQMNYLKLQARIWTLVTNLRITMAFSYI